MRYRKLDDDGDYVFGNGSAVFLTDAEAVAQAIKTRIMHWTGEWWEDMNSGTPMQNIIGSRNLQYADEAIRKRVLDTQHVQSIIFWDSSFNQDSRSLKVAMAVETDYGIVEQEVVTGGI